ncbi:MAG TPA: hypothetical protein PKL67_08335 [Anaerolineae bacterium]|nr:hypothetical protein [Anaerolineae bacterium]
MFFPARRIFILLVLLVLLAVLAASAAVADGPVIWKEHCPRHHEVQTIPDAGGDGVHILCVRAARPAR